ncbi:DUF3592 domain-containing protein [Streptomyces sp. NPDC058045]|uniref:DUF3592 domain-containing protein n=1 Tax=Streptomyces sp. NPDC058045 TaxID=3346311 RepID=UPI0036E78849
MRRPPRQGEESPVWLTLAVVGDLVIIAFGVHEAVIQRRLVRDGLRAEGTVISVRQVSNGKGGGHHDVPLVRFVDAQGRAHEFEPNSSVARDIPMGGRAPVIYLPSSPDTARIDGTRIRVLTLGGLLMGALVFTFGAIRLIQMGG